MHLVEVKHEDDSKEETRIPPSILSSLEKLTQKKASSLT
jgi:hypothetical protein